MIWTVDSAKLSAALFVCYSFAGYSIYLINWIKMLQRIWPFSESNDSWHRSLASVNISWTLTYNDWKIKRMYYNGFRRKPNSVAFRWGPHQSVASDIHGPRRAFKTHLYDGNFPWASTVLTLCRQRRCVPSRVKRKGHEWMTLSLSIMRSQY